MYKGKFEWPNGVTESKTPKPATTQWSRPTAAI
jgi:hypothetical protein